MPRNTVSYEDWLDQVHQREADIQSWQQEQADDEDRVLGVSIYLTEAELDRLAEDCKQHDALMCTLYG